jgi:hypothetical protein
MPMKIRNSGCQILCTFIAPLKPDSMKKKLLIALAVLAVLIVAGMFYLNNRSRTLSPPGKAELTAGDLTVSIPYSRPSVRGRVIFGTKEEGALQPYGVFWRVGANESTEITINRDVLFNGTPLKQGTYKMYAIPGPDEFEVRLNSELGTWGYFEPNHEMDVLSTRVPVERLATPVEQHTIRLEPSENGMSLIVEFANIRFTVPLTRS